MPAQVIDLFCGVGGLTRGILDSGLNVIAGFDLDTTCTFAYETNNNVPFVEANIRNVHAEDLERFYNENDIRVLVGCAPCQPFSTMRTKMGDDNFTDEKYDLLLEFARLVRETRPSIISMENVPKIRHTNVFRSFLDTLEELNYNVYYEVVYCPDYGIPQNRRRLVLLASQLGEITLLPPTHNRAEVNVREHIEDLPQIEAGEIDPIDPMHRTAKLSEKNIKRIKHSVPGGTWRDWPEDLRCECHKKESGKTFSSVYGRMRWDAIGPTMTTQFYCYGTGRYGHPEQNRALTLREGALLQTFPREYNFIDPDVPFKIGDIARHIGNAVPVRLGEVIGQSIQEHLNEYRIQP